MSMYAQKIGSIPAEMMRIAQAACPKGTLAMRLRDALGALYTDKQFAVLYPMVGQPAYAPWRLAVVTVLQYSENLTDRQAANAVRERIDWKYSLGLDLSDAGFDYSLLSAFRTRLVEQQAETLLLDRLLEVCKQHGWLKAGASNAPILPMCWRGCGRCPTWNAWERRCVRRCDDLATGRALHVRPQAAHETLQAQRRMEQTPEFQQQYALRSSIEGTLSQAVRGMGIRRSRYDGLARTRLQHVLTAVAINLVRIDAVLTHQPRGKTRRSYFSQLTSPPALPDRIGA